MNLRIENEIEALSSIYLDRIKMVPSKPNKTIEITLSSNSLGSPKSHHPFCWVKTRVEYQNNYPLRGPIITIFEKYNLLDSEVENIEKHIELIIQNRIKQNYEMVHEICQYVQIFLNQKANLNDPKNSGDSSDEDNDDSLSDIHPKKEKIDLIKSKSEKLSDMNIKNPFENLRDVSGDASSNKKKIEEIENVPKLEISKENSALSASSPIVLTSRFHSDFEIKQKLGEGGGGSVYKVRNKWDGNIYAIKIIQVNIYNFLDENKVLSKVLNEGYVLSRLQHSHIVRYYQTWVEDFDSTLEKLLAEDNVSSCYEMGCDSDSEFSKDIVLDDSNTIKKVLFIQMEYCEGNTLKEAIETKLLQEEQKWKLIIQILDAVNYIHKNNLIHRDMKPGNIFLDKNNEVKIGDFGLARISKKNPENVPLATQSKNKSEFILVNNGNEIMTYNIGTKYYCSPEQERQKSYDNKSDMFSLGIIIFEMFYSFGSLIERDKILRKIKDKHIFPENFTKQNKQNIVDIVTMLTETNASKRPSSRELLDSTLIPVIVNEKVVIGNFEKIIFDNKNYTEKFIDILIKSSVKDINEQNKQNDIKDTETHLSHNSLMTPLQSCEAQTKILFGIKKFLIKEKSLPFKHNQISLYEPWVKVYDSISNEIIKTPIDADEDEFMLKKNGKVYVISSTKEILKEIGDMISIEGSSSYLSPCSFHCEKNRDFISTMVWSSNFICDSDEIYIIKSFRLMFEVLRGFNFDTKKILIKINSTIIIDSLLKTIPNIEAKFQLIKELRNNKGKTVNKELLSLINVKGNIENMKNKYGKRDFASEIHFISGLFDRNNMLWNQGNYKHLLKKYRDCIKIDASLTNENNIFYSRLLFQIYYLKEDENILLIEGGNFDNLINEKEIFYHGFGMVYKIDNFLNILPLSSDEDCINQNYKIDILLIRSGEVKDKEYEKVSNLINNNNENIQNCGYEVKILYKNFDEDNINFMNFFNFYQMKILLCVHSKPSNIKTNENKSNYTKLMNEEEEEEDEDEIGEIVIDIITKEKTKRIPISEFKFEKITSTLVSVQFKKRKMKN